MTFYRFIIFKCIKTIFFSEFSELIFVIGEELFQDIIDRKRETIFCVFCPQHRYCLLFCVLYSRLHNNWICWFELPIYIHVYRIRIISHTKQTTNDDAHSTNITKWTIRFFLHYRMEFMVNNILQHENIVTRYFVSLVLVGLFLSIFDLFFSRKMILYT